ncbi:MAG: histidine--tRNA ligase family protein [Dehalococcoidia bacterium]|nr:histidine--tRNA ligase family protein [Dehalococcoidia bacterium]MDW8119614.1 HisS family protein [Chloroflexota bacterium]
MRDWDEEACMQRHTAVEALQQVLRSYGYAWIDTPFLERTDLFLRKSGAELITRLYSFTEPGGQVVALRPEFTTAVMRRFLEVRSGLPLPVRWHYVGPVFRFDPSPHALRQFTQVGAEMIGASGSRADAELLALTQECILALKGTGFVLTVGHRGCLDRLLAPFGLSSRAQALLLRGIPLLRSGEHGPQRLLEQAHSLALFRGAGPPADLEALVSTLNGGVDSPSPGDKEAVSPLFGGRTREEILARLARKLHALDEPPRFQKAVHFLTDLARLRGEPHQVLAEAYALARHWNLDPAPLVEVEALLDTLTLHRSPGMPLLLDLALVRDIAYYTGMVFEVVHTPTGQVVAGGGRYDGLVSALGLGEDVPALGFALSLERLMEVSPSVAPRRSPRRVLVAPADADAYPDALRIAEALRFGGDAVAVAFAPLSPAERQGWAQQGHAIVVVHKGGSCDYFWP